MTTANSSPPSRDGARRRRQRALETLGEAAQQPVADRVTEPVVDVLEAIEVHHEHQRMAVVGHPVEGDRQPIVERPSIEQHRERVVVGLVLALECGLGRVEDEERRDAEQRQHQDAELDRDHEHRRQGEQGAVDGHAEGEPRPHHRDHADPLMDADHGRRQQAVDEEDRHTGGDDPDAHADR